MRLPEKGVRRCKQRADAAEQEQPGAVHEGTLKLEKLIGCFSGILDKLLPGKQGVMLAQKKRVVVAQVGAVKILQLLQLAENVLPAAGGESSGRS